MNLFIDTVSCPSYICLWDDERNIISDYSWDARMNESSTLIPNIKSLLLHGGYAFKDLENIVLVSGPGSFTGVRTTTLVANTLSYLNKETKLSDITYFDLFENYPIIKKSSRRDCFVKMSKNSEIEIIMNPDLENLIKSNYSWDKIDSLEFDVYSKPDYEKIIKNLEFRSKDIVSPFYYKKPNIT